MLPLVSSSNCPGSPDIPVHERFNDVPFGQTFYMASSHPHSMPWTQDWLDDNPGRVNDYHMATMSSPQEAKNVYRLFTGMGYLPSFVNKLCQYEWQINRYWAKQEVKNKNG